MCFCICVCKRERKSARVSERVYVCTETEKKIGLKESVLVLSLYTAMSL